MDSSTLMLPPPAVLRPPILGRREPTEGPRAQRMTSKQLVINTKPAMENSDNTGTKIDLPDYSDLLAKERALECQFRGSDAPPAPIVFIDGKLALQGGSGKHTLLDGKAIITSDDIVIESVFREGLPKGKARISITAQEIHSYWGSVTLEEERCHIVCTTRLINGLIVLTPNGMAERAITDDLKLLNTAGYVLIEDILIGGNWREGQPDGNMSCQRTVGDAFVSYSGPLLISIKGGKADILHNGEGTEVTLFNGGGSIIVKAKWDKGSLAEKTEETTITSYRKLESTNPPSANTREYIGKHVKGKFSVAGSLITGKEIDYQEHFTMTTILENQKVIKKIGVCRRTGKTTIDWPQQGRSYQGPISDDLPHGEGMMTFPNKRTYNGCFSAGLQCGFGVATYEDKTVYEGGYHEDKRHGRGTVTWGPSHERAKHRYDGFFVEDKRTGEGTYFYPSGKSIKGVWQDSQLITFSTKDGAYTGVFNDQFEQLCGKGKFVATSGGSYEGEWKNGEFVGVIVTATLEKFQCQGPVNNKGQLHGLCSTQTWTDGAWTRKTKENWKDGVRLLVQQPTPTVAKSKPVKMGTPATTSLVTPAVVKSKETAPPKQQEPKKVRIKDYLGIGQFEGRLNGANNPTGIGIITGSDGTVYHCDFNNGQLSAPATVTIIRPNGYKYIGSGEMVISPEAKKRRDVYIIQPSGAGAIHNPSGELVCKGDWAHGELTRLTYPDGSQFKGAVDEVFQPVNGKMKHTDGTVMKGLWRASKLVEGTIIDPSGKTHTGQFDDLGRPHGNGVSHWTDSQGKKNCYKGPFSEGLAHGKGIHTVDGHQIYEGTLENGVRQGPGVMTLVNKTIIKGHWINDKLVDGTIIHPDGRTYTGDLDEMGRAHGEGESNWIDNQGRKNNYKGAFNEDQRHGRGVHSVNGHQVYQGEFGRDEYHGWGKLKLQEGESASYEGYFENGKFKPIAATIIVNQITYRPLSNYPTDDVLSLSFYGEMHWSNAEHYAGRMKNGVPHGYGRWVLPSNTVYKGTFFESRLQGLGEIKFANGNEYQGYFVDGEINGPGIFYRNDGTIYSANFTPETFANLTFDYGQMLSHQGYHFSGPIMQGSPYGYGTLTLDSGAVFEGLLFNRQG